MTCASEGSSQLIRDVEIENFRCFERAELHDCGLINVILGKNASGKTALLEALFLALGPAEVATRFRPWRGYDLAFGGTNSLELDRQMWRDLFNDFDMTKEIMVALKGNDEHERAVKVRYHAGQAFTPIQPNAIAAFPSPIEFEYTRPGDQVRIVKANFFANGYQFNGNTEAPPEGAFFTSNNTATNQENVERFSRLSLARKDSEMVSIISSEFEFIRGLDVLSFGGVPALHIDSPWYAEKRPLASISAGVSKFVSILLAMSSMPGGVVLIDEIENGFYFDRYETIWGSIIDVAVKNKVQVFASSHSFECLEALKKAAAARNQEVGFVRTSVGARGRVELDQFHTDSIFTAISEGREIR